MKELPDQNLNIDLLTQSLGASCNTFITLKTVIALCDKLQGVGVWKPAREEKLC